MSAPSFSFVPPALPSPRYFFPGSFTGVLSESVPP